MNPGNAQSSVLESLLGLERLAEKLQQAGQELASEYCVTDRLDKKTGRHEGQTSSN